MTPRWRWRLLTGWIVVFTVLVGVLLFNQHDQARKAQRAAMVAKAQNVNQQALICAIREYVEGMYLITASSGTQPKDVLMARRAVIQRFEQRMDGNCKP